MGKMTKAELRHVYEAWKREEIEQILLTEAVAAYLEGRPAPTQTALTTGGTTNGK